MEIVPAHVHLGPIVTDVLSIQHEHRSGLIWSGDRETCYTNLQCGRFGRNLFQCYSAARRRLRLLGVRLSLSHFSDYKVKKEPLEEWILRAFTSSETDDDLILRARGFIFLLIGGHMLPDFFGNLVHVHYRSFCALSFGGCTTDWRGFGVSSDMGMGVVVYTYIVASADDGDYDLTLLLLLARYGAQHLTVDSCLRTLWLHTETSWTLCHLTSYALQ
ncbi:hypothetical protein M9H77_21268 [Catharanthus roseus]|uniref:Uncharacterized protein n=1 Tax=Catharanthus roseus TaxID=4058 RepID=A0ACC0AM42_CATRO|nr:hypothetical protein M9H77_21268 [Catharanthus roseus]